MCVATDSNTNKLVCSASVDLWEIGSFVGGSTGCYVNDDVFETNCAKGRPSGRAIQIIQDNMDMVQRVHEMRDNTGDLATGGESISNKWRKGRGGEMYVI